MYVDNMLDSVNVKALLSANWDMCFTYSLIDLSLSFTVNFIPFPFICQLSISYMFFLYTSHSPYF